MTVNHLSKSDLRNMLLEHTKPEMIQDNSFEEYLMSKSVTELQTELKELIALQRSQIIVDEAEHFFYDNEYLQDLADWKIKNRFFSYNAKQPRVNIF